MPRLMALLEAGHGGNGYHAAVYQRWHAEWPQVLSEFEALLVVETPRGLAGFAGIQRHPIPYTEGLERALADHFLSPDLDPGEAIVALVDGLADWARERGFARVTLNMEPQEADLLSALAGAGGFPERVAMFTNRFPDEPLDPTIRPMRPEELDAVAAMGAEVAAYLATLSGSLPSPPREALVALTREGYRDYGATRPHAFFVAEREGRLVGFVFAVVEPPDGGLIYDLYVAPACRRQGIARALYRRAAGWLAEQGAEWLTLSVYALNRPAYAAYEQWGFFPFFVAWERNL
ncbi:MAG TPA: GNAT family N-acetyltransferase [Pantanalinema sp.]